MSGLPVRNFVTRDVEDPAGSGSVYGLKVKGVFYTSLKGVLNLFFKEEGILEVTKERFYVGRKIVNR